MKKLLILFSIICMFLLTSVSASIWRDDPTTCPNVFQSQTCAGSDLVCGSNGGVTFCWDMTTLNPPGSNKVSNSGDTYQSGFDGGFIIDCEAYDGSAPHCDNSGNLWCNRNNTCLSTRKRQTECIKDVWATSNCAGCRTGYLNCSADIETQDDSCEVQIGSTNCAGGARNNINGSCSCVCDSNWYNCDASAYDAGSGCEVNDGGSCSVGSLVGTYDCSVGAGGCFSQLGGTQQTCTCVVDKSFFETGTFIQYLVDLADGAMLWFKNFGTGATINATDRLNQTFLVNESGVFWNDTLLSGEGSGQTDTWRLNYTFYWNGSQTNNAIQGNKTTDTWNLNKTFYFNKSATINNFFRINGSNANQNISIGSFYYGGRFNWTSGDTWNLFDGVTLTFNESRLSTQFFNASAIQVITGTPQGSLAGLRTYNNSAYNLSEVSSDLELRVNFSVGVGDDFNQFIVRYKSTEEDEPHILLAQIYEPNNGLWEDYGVIPAIGTYHVVSFPVFDSDEHIGADGIVQVRFFQDEGVPPKTHKHEFDWVTLARGFGVPSGEEVDPGFNNWLINPIFEFNVNGSAINSTWDYIFPTKINWTNQIVNETQFSFTNFLLEIKKSWLFKLFYTKAESNDNLNNNVTAINDTPNIQSLGFYANGDNANFTETNTTTWHINNIGASACNIPNGTFCRNDSGLFYQSGTGA